MNLYLIEFTTPFKKGGDDEENAVRETAARNGLQVGRFHPRLSMLEIEGFIDPGTIFLFRDYSIKSIA